MIFRTLHRALHIQISHAVEKHRTGYKKSWNWWRKNFVSLVPVMCDAALRKAIARLQTVSSSASLASYLHNLNLYRRYRAGSTIRVQLTALSRRRPEVTRSSKRLAFGRPPLGSAAVSKKKKPRCLVQNVTANVPNAKPHGR